jgi:hypothetical protein
MRPPGPVARPPLNGASGNSCLPLAESEASFARIERPARRGEAPQNQASGGGLRLQNACAGASARVLAALAASKHEELEAEALDDAGIYVAAGETRNDVVDAPGSRFHTATRISRLRARALLSAESAPPRTIAFAFPPARSGRALRRQRDRADPTVVDVKDQRPARVTAPPVSLDPLHTREFVGGLGDKGSRSGNSRDIESGRLARRLPSAPPSLDVGLAESGRP